MLLKPEVKQAGKEQIKNKARKSIKEKLAQGKLDADRENRSAGSVKDDCSNKKTGYGIVRHLIFYGNRMPFALFGGGRNECI